MSSSINKFNYSPSIDKFSLNPSIFEYQLKTEMEQEIESCMPLYLDVDWIDLKYLSECHQKLKNHIKESQEKNDLKKYNFIQERLQVLVFQNPSFQISSMFKDLLLEKNLQEPRISKYFLNEDFPSIIQLQNALIQGEECELFLNQCNTKRISDFSNSSGDLDLSTAESGEEVVNSNKFNLEREILLKQRIISNDKITSEEFRILLARIFNAFNGRIPNIFRPFLFFPEYLESIFSSFEQTFLEPSAWPFHQLYQMALMTASTYESNYVFLMFGEIYQSYSGSTDFLVEGFEALEPKVKKAWDLIQFLKNNHSTSLLNQNAMSQLFHSLMKQTPSWSQSEIISAIFAISLSQQLSSLSHCLGLIGENDFNCKSKRISQETAQSNENQQINEVDIKRAFHIFKSSSLVEPSSKEELDILEEMEDHQQMNFNNFKESNYSSKFIKYIGDQESILSSPCKNQAPEKLKKRYQLSELTYNWSNNAIEFIGSRNNDLSNILNKKFKQIQKLTFDNNVSSQQIECQTLRKAIWNYCEISMGYLRFGYNYKEMNSLLSKNFKAFLSKKLYKPHYFVQADIDSLRCQMQPQEIIHTIFLSSESKFYTQINFLLYSLQQFLK